MLTWEAAPGSARSADRGQGENKQGFAKGHGFIYTPALIRAGGQAKARNLQKSVQQPGLAGVSACQPGLLVWYNCVSAQIG